MRAARREPNVCMLSFLYVPLLIVLLWTIGFILTRVELFHEDLRSEELKREREAWLIQVCRKPEFYTHMKHHSALCDEVEVHAKGSVYMTAAIHLVQNTYLCGYVPCATALDYVLEWMSGHTMLFACAAALIMLLPTLVLPFYREHTNYTANKYIDNRYHRSRSLEAPIQYGDHSFLKHQYCITPLAE